MIQKGEIITLDNYKKYVVISSATIEADNYIYLLSKDKMTDSLFCKLEEGGTLSEIQDEKVIDQLLIKFREELTN